MNNSQSLDSSAFLETTDPNVIQEWALVRGGVPVREMNDPAGLKILFEENGDTMKDVQKISWGDFFQIFAENNYKFCYMSDEDESGTVALDRDYKIEPNDVKEFEQEMPMV